MLIVGPAARVGELAGAADVATISFRSPDAAAVAAPGRHLALVFNDIAAPRDGLVAPARADVEAMLAFAAAREPLVLCCYAGISRSTAAAYAIACARTAAGEEMALAAALRALSPSATPNPLIVAHADAILGREGAMIRAIAAIGRGAEAFESAPFRWSV